jgi:hypothetical protein
MPEELPVVTIVLKADLLISAGITALDEVNFG